MDYKLFLSFNVITFIISSWVIQGRNMNEKDNERVPSSLVFSRMPLPFFSIQGKFWFQRSAWRIWGNRASDYRVVNTAQLLRTSLILAKLHIWWGHQNSALMRHQELYIWMGWWQQTDTLCVSPLPTCMLHCPIRCHLAKHKFKNKIIKNFRTVIAGHYAKGEPHLNTGPCVTALALGLLS